VKSQYPIFIVGSPRSGTSITCWTLGKHPKIQYHETETNIFNLELEKLFRNPYRWLAIEEYSKFLEKKALSSNEKQALILLKDEALIFDEIAEPLRSFFDQCLLTQENKTTFIHITHNWGGRNSFELEIENDPASRFSSYMTDEYKSDEAEYLKAKADLIDAANNA